MNEIRRPVRADEEIASFREIVARHPAPSFVTGFDVEFGEYEDFPAVWITLRLVTDLPAEKDRADQWIAGLNAMIDAVRDDILTNRPDRFPYFDMQLA